MKIMKYSKGYNKHIKLNRYIFSEIKNFFKTCKSKWIILIDKNTKINLYHFKWRVEKTIQQNKILINVILDVLNYSFREIKSV